MLELKDNDADMAMTTERMKQLSKSSRKINEYKLDDCLENTDIMEEIKKFDFSKRSKNYVDAEMALKSITDIDDFKYSELQPTIIAVRDPCTNDLIFAGKSTRSMNLLEHLLPSLHLPGIKHDYKRIGCSANASPSCENEYVKDTHVPPNLDYRVRRESIVYYEIDSKVAANIVK